MTEENITIITSHDGVKSLHITTLSSVCRACLGSEDMTPISNLTFGRLKGVEILQFALSLEVNIDDKFPNNICITCLKELNRIINFRQQYVKSDTFLKAMYEMDTSFISGEATKHMPSVEYALPTKGFHHTYSVKNKECNTQAEMKKGGIVSETMNEDIEKQFETTNEISCHVCKDNFPTRELLKFHQDAQKHHYLRPKNYLCEICSKPFRSLYELKQHMLVHTKERPYSCPYCSRSFNDDSNLRRHTKIHTGEKRHICEVCGKGFIQSASLYSHQKKLHSSKGPGEEESTRPYNCAICGRSFKGLFGYESHHQRHSASWTGKKAELYVQVDEVAKTENHSNDQKYPCSQCSRTYKTLHAMKQHQLTHGEKLHLCSECGRSFHRKADLEQHLRVHTGEKPFTCTTCNKSFTHGHSLQSHMLTHTGQRPYCCKYCNKKFSQWAHLNYHVRIHTGEKPYKCKFCNKSFRLNGNLTVHLRIHTGETPHLCRLCGKGFYDSSSMKKHQKTHKDKEQVLENIISS